MSAIQRIADAKRRMRLLEAGIARIYERPEEFSDPDAVLEEQVASHVVALKEMCEAMAEHPTGYAIYQVFDATGDLLYIGMTGDVGERIMTHFGTSWRYRRENEWAEEAAEVLVSLMPSRLVAEATEKELIRRRAPKYNKTHNNVPQTEQRGMGRESFNRLRQLT